ncbi:EamA family transporter RarD [Conchiformibius kuhniae]|uniref:EamA family transporter RarD n=1 Tax=Conchiformibius kuhniae TaxID=211502 RepID=A0ABD8B7S2_9NEIS|nr:EamA family transporter RarD [Conchiformibius kuhniae]
MDAAARHKQGLHYALLCYVFWGLFPIYWYPLNQSAMPAEQILAQRVLWSAVFAVVLGIALKQSRTVLAALVQPKILLPFAVSALLIGINWLVYLWSIVHNRVLEASLGYFINPLFSVFLGRVVLKEALNRVQALALLLAAAGIAWLALPAGHVPWVALLLTASFGVYGLMRKRAPMDALPGLILETLLLAPFALLYLLWCARTGSFYGFSQLTPLQSLVLLGSGVATTVPLLLFAAGARRISLSLLGVLQYIAPTLQLLVGLTLFGERLTPSQLAGYTLVWAGAAVFLWGLYRRPRHHQGNHHVSD